MWSGGVDEVDGEPGAGAIDCDIDVVGSGDLDDGIGEELSGQSIEGVAGGGGWIAEIVLAERGEGGGDGAAAELNDGGFLCGVAEFGLEQRGGLGSNEEEGSAGLDIIDEFLFEGWIEVGTFGEDDEGVFRHASGEIVFAEDFDGELAFEEGLEGTPDAGEVAREEAVAFAVVGCGGIEQGDLWDGQSAMADGLSIAAELGDLGHDGDFFEFDRPIAALGEIGLEPPAEGENGGGFALELDGGLLDPGSLAVAVGEAPGHEIPGFALSGEVSGGESSGVDAVLGGVVTGEPIDGGADGFGHVIGEGPIAAELHLGVCLFDLCDVVAEVLSELFAVELEEFEPMGVAGFARDVLDSGCLAEGVDGGVTEVGLGCPALAVDPGAIDGVDGGQFAQLGDEEVVGIGAEEGDGVGIRFAVGVDDGPIGVFPDGLGVPDAGVMHIERDAVFGGDIAPESEGIADEAWGLVSDVGGIAGESRMSFAVDLDVIGMDQVDDGLDHLASGVFSDFLAVIAGVEIEMDAEEAVGAGDSFGMGLGRGSLGGADCAGEQEQESEGRAKSVRVC